MSDKVVLSYHDVCLYESDVILLQHGKWLNDIIIGFIYEYFEYEQFKMLTKDFGFISPELVQFIKLSNCNSDIRDQTSGLDLSSKELLFLPINDNVSYEHAGGMHWSLLVYERHRGIFHHFDSANQMNDKHARNTAEKIFNVLTGSCGKDIIFNSHLESPQQDNSYDCGVYIICITEIICNRYKQLNSNPKSNMEILFNDVTVTTVDANNKRLDIKKMIEEMSSHA